MLYFLWIRSWRYEVTAHWFSWGVLQPFKGAICKIWLEFLFKTLNNELSLSRPCEKTTVLLLC